MARRPVSCRIRIDSMPARSETVLTEAGPNALVLSTTLRDRGIWLDSTYLGHGGAETQTAHLMVAPGRVGETESRAVPHDETTSSAYRTSSASWATWRRSTASIGPSTP
jgi:hypothetical protein